MLKIVNAADTVFVASHNYLFKWHIKIEVR